MGPIHVPALAVFQLQLGAGQQPNELQVCNIIRLDSLFQTKITCKEPTLRLEYQMHVST